MRSPFAAVLLVSSLLAPGCMYRIGSGLVAGALDEVAGEGRSKGMSKMGDELLEKQLLADLGHQLGQGLSSGATDISPEQQARLEATIDGLISVATSKAGKGIRNDVSPELREMIRKDIIQAFSEGLRGELGDSLEATVDRVIARTTSSLKTAMQDEDLQYAMSDLVRESIYLAMREGNGATPAVSETLQTTLTENMLGPFEQSVGKISEDVAAQVSSASTRTEQTLRGVIGALILMTMGLGVLYLVRGRQLAREREQTTQARRVLDLLDGDMRQKLVDKMSESEQLVQPAFSGTHSGRAPTGQTQTGRKPPPATVPPKKPGDDYER